jgi:crotonobetainyl-CoA:carnitine CoA-transferase CaiB-like acyl-CoA transferase
MNRVMEGIRVLEVSQWGFVPSAGATLADWGATVLKVEHPILGDPMRGFLSSTVPSYEGVNFMWEIPNRGKRGLAIDLATPEGRELIYRIAETCDVFLTGFLAPVRRKLGIDIDDIRARNPRIVYVRATGQGPRGPDAEKGGYDSASFWARAGISAAITPPGADLPIPMPGPGFGDFTSGTALAGGTAAALLRRERTGEPAIVDVSLLATGMWSMAPAVSSSVAVDTMPQNPPLTPNATVAGKSMRVPVPNPLVCTYRCKDSRFLNLVLLQSDRFWPELCEKMGRPDIVDDPRFANAKLRADNSIECMQLLEDLFVERTLDEWREAFAGMKGVWAPVQSADDLHQDPQAIVNGYLPTLQTTSGHEIVVVASPAQFDEISPALTGAPELGQHTEETLLEIGLTWEDISSLKEKGVIL